jgi:myo-inositol 2-dehydrogenase / D-chiro-inositol 1-dehydrogenase
VHPSTLSPLNVVVIGCGAVTRLYYTPALQLLQLEGLIRVGALFDPSPSRVAAAAAVFPNAACPSSLDALTPAGVDLAVIASPAQFHAEQTVRLLEAGVAVLCEKPMAVSVAEAARMVASARSTGSLLAVGMVRRFFPATRAIRSALTSGMLGDLISIDGFEGNLFRWPVASPGYFSRSSGGTLLDIGIHALDLLTWWLGEPTHLRYEDDAMGGIEVNCRVHLEYPSGVRVRLQLSRDWARPNEYVFRGTRGQIRWRVDEVDSLRVEWADSSFAIHGRLTGAAGDRFPSGARVSSTFEQCFVDQLRNVVGAVRGTQSREVTGEDGLRALRIVERCNLTRAQMPMPWLGETEQRRAHALAATR